MTDEKMLLGKPPCIEDVDIDFGHVDMEITPGVQKRGRKKGLTRIFKDQMAEQFEKRMKKDFQYVLTSVVQEAREGNIQAAKLLFDRVIPTNKAIDSSQVSKIPQININIGTLEEEDKKVVSEQ